MSDPIDCLAFQASLTCNSGTREPAPPKTISDDFGSTWPATCAACGQDTMEVVRPGKAQCGACDGNGKPITEGVPAPPPVEGETGHTPGPWAKDYGGTVGHIKAIGYRPDGKTPTVARYDMAAESVPQSEREANAALIARAPEMAAEIATLREQLADADRTLAGFVKAVREARECIVTIREMADSIDAMPSTAAFAIRETCDRWLNPPLAAVPAARVLTGEEGQS